MAENICNNENRKLYKFNLADRIFDDLYLNNKMSDVNFLLPKEMQENPSTSEDVEFVKIPAHKFILAAASDSFSAMFYGPAKETGDVKIIDSYADAFKEFLQCFYLREGSFTKENIAEVMILANKYMIDDCSTACNDFLNDNITLNDVCCVYELAIFFDRSDLRKSCEEVIKSNTATILRSAGFLDCDHDTLTEILKLNLKCKETDVFDGCMAWAKNTCKIIGLDEDNNENLRNQLGECFLHIRFGNMTIKELSQCISKYPGLFQNDELEDLMKCIECIGINGFKSSKFAQEPRLHWDNSKIWQCQTTTGYKFWGPLGKFETFRIISNKTTLLGGIYCPHLYSFSRNTFVDLDSTLKIIEKSTVQDIILFYGTVPFRRDIRFKLPTPIVIRKDVTYEFQLGFDGSPYLGHEVSLFERCNEVKSPNGLEIKFDGSEYHLISCLDLLDR